MSRVDLVVKSDIDLTPRVKQLSGMFDVPLTEKLERSWHGDVPIEAQPWNVGLIVGPSGAGKSSIMRQMFGEPTGFDWRAKSVIDDFGEHSIKDITEVCSAVGFNTIPSWMKPYHVLSTGEKFRVELARHLLEGNDPIVIDEFTSVVDRQVAHIGSHAVQKFIRRNARKFVAVTCHYDVIEWLQPDWILEPATMNFQWRSVQRRPAIDIEISRVDYEAWSLFAPFHYLTADLNKAARCYGLYADGALAAFAGVLYRPHPKADDVYGVSRLVTLPDYQGMGLAMVLVDALGAQYRAMRKRLHTYPAHPALIRTFDRSRCWTLKQKPGAGNNRRNINTKSDLVKAGSFGGRPCAMFEYVGPPADDLHQARLLIS